jgi:hypothetical protein
MKSIKVLLASAMMVPMLAMGMVAVTPVVDSAYAEVGSITDGAKAAQGEGQSDKLFGDGGIFTEVVNALLFVIGAISVLMLIYGGIRYTISGGNDKDVATAKNTILYAIIGIIVALMAYAIVNFVLSSLVAN